MDIERLHKLGSDLGRIAAELSATLPHADVPNSLEAAAANIRAVLRSRRMRQRMLPGGLFADPALDMLLELTVHHAEHRSISITALCDEAGVAQTTGLRWITVLEASGLIGRAPHPTDRRKAHIQLTEKGAGAMLGYVAAVNQAGLPIA